jgi:hypothetical protein
VAIDYLLQPYQPAIDAAPVLGRLVNMSGCKATSTTLDQRRQQEQSR